MYLGLFITHRLHFKSQKIGWSEDFKNHRKVFWTFENGEFAISSYVASQMGHASFNFQHAL